MKGTEWYWNRWDTVKFQKDGTFEARTESCMAGGCKWAAYKHKGENKIFVLWGSDGLHVMRVEGKMPESQEADELNSIELMGYRAKDNREPSRKKEPCNAIFEKVFDHDAFKDSADLYDVIGLGDKSRDDITMADIKKSYRKLSLKYHPDKNTDPAMIAKYQAMSAAYEVLSNEEKRAKYDCCGMEGVKGEMPSGKDMETGIRVSLEELYTGSTDRRDYVRRRVICRACRDNPEDPKCASCGKCPNEVKLVNQQIGPGMIIQQQQDVPSKEKCKQEQATLHTEIVRGMRDGDTITFPHKGEQSPGQLPGNVVVKVSQKKHNKFERRGNDLHMQIKISLKEAMLGFEREIKHLDGHTVDLNQKNPTQPYQVFKIANEGMPFKDDPTQFGSLFVKAEVVFPNRFTEPQKKLVNELFKEKTFKEEL